jgi:hypothetical protein
MANLFMGVKMGAIRQSLFLFEALLGGSLFGFFWFAGAVSVRILILSERLLNFLLRLIIAHRFLLLFNFIWGCDSLKRLHKKFREKCLGLN